MVGSHRRATQASVFCNSGKKKIKFLTLSDTMNADQICATARADLCEDTMSDVAGLDEIGNVHEATTTAVPLVCSCDMPCHR